METPLARIERLERGNRRMLIALSALLVLFAGMVGAVRSSDRTLPAQSLEIVDANGRQRLLLGGAAQGSVIVLNDVSGKQRVGLIASETTNALRLFTRDGEEVASFQSEGGHTGLIVSSQHKVTFFGNVNSSPGISMAAGGGYFKISNAEGTAPSLIVSDANNKDRIGFGQTGAGDFSGFIAGKSAETSDYTMPNR